MKKGILGFAILIVGTLLAFGSNPSQTKADGGIFYPPYYNTAETRQKAFIYYANHTENLVVVASFQGNAKDFAWVIPTPSKPEINKSSVDLFNNLATLTNNTVSGPERVYHSSSLSLGSAPKSTPVDVIEEKTVDMYDTAILQATDANALAKWLTDHGYSFPADKSSDLQSYVDNGWYFAIAKIKPNLITSGGIAPELQTGTLTPLRLTFPTDKIIYPMKLTGLALTQTTSLTPTPTLAPSAYPVPPQSTGNYYIPIFLYVLSDHKTEQSQLTTNWANWLDQSQINKINDNLGANLVSDPKLFLTEMNDTVNIKDIKGDFIITPASNDNIIPTPSYKTAGFWGENLLFLLIVPLIIIFFPIPIGLVFLVFFLLQLYVKKKWLYIIGSIYQILTSLMIPFVGLLLILAYRSDNMGANLSDLWLESGFIGAFVACVIVEFFAVYATIKMLKRYKKVFSPSVE